MHVSLIVLKCVLTMGKLFRAMEPGMKKRPLQAIARLFNKSQKKSEKGDGSGSGKGSSTYTKKSSSARDIASKY
jgi:hypothetical protein